jgi:hypothetical protein
VKRLLALALLLLNAVPASAIMPMVGAGPVVIQASVTPGGGGGCSGLIDSDDFTTGSSGALSGYGGWEGNDVTAGYWRIDATTDEAHSNQTFGIDAQIVGTVTCNDYYAEIYAKAGTTAGAQIAASVRLDASADNVNGYRARIVHDDGELVLERVDSGTVVELDFYTIPSYSGNTYYLLRLRVVGTALTAFIDGVEVASTTDATYATGKPGMYVRRTSPRVTTFEAGY